MGHSCPDSGNKARDETTPMQWHRSNLTYALAILISCCPNTNAQEYSLTSAGEGISLCTDTWKSIKPCGKVAVFPKWSIASLPEFSGNDALRSSGSGLSQSKKGYYFIPGIGYIKKRHFEFSATGEFRGFDLKMEMDRHGADMAVDLGANVEFGFRFGGGGRFLSTDESHLFIGINQKY